MIFRRLRLVSYRWLWLLVLLFAQVAKAQLLTDDFNATTPPYSLTTQGWSAHSGAGTNSISATLPGLTYAGIATKGGAASLTTSGEDVNRTFSQQNSGSVYASFLVNVSSAQTAGDYFLHFGGTAIGTVFGGRVWVKSATGGIQFGVSKATDTNGPVYNTDTTYSLNTTYFLVLKYTIVAGSANDIAGLFIEPALNKPEPSVTLSATSTAGDLSNVGSIALRQGSASSAPNVRVDYIRVGTSWGDVTTGSAPVAALSASPTALAGFNAVQGTASSSQAYTLTGSTLGTSPVSVSATSGIELSTDKASFGPTLSVTPSSGSVSQTIYARLSGSSSTGSFAGTITNTANGTLTASLTVSGQVNAPNTPTLVTSTTALSGFSATQGTPSAQQSYTLTTSNLASDISVTAPAGVEVSTTSNSGFASSLTIPAATASPIVYVRLTAASAGLISGTITNSSGGLTAPVSVSGTVNSNSPYTPISIARAGVGTTYTIQGRVTVTNQLGARQIYIQDETGGIVVYASPSGTDISSLVQIGDLVQARGPITVFNGFTEITSPAATNFTLVSGAGTVVPAPIEITPDQLPNYQGRLVSISNASISGSGATFVGGTSYTITKDNQSATLRISANSPLAGAGRPSNPVSVTGIADRFVSGVTTPGNNGLQLQPRILADIPGSTAAQDAICGPAENTALPRTQTLDVAAWNMEFFGADAGSINCSKGTYTYEDMGPVNEDLQQANATAVLTKLNADIISVEEISDINRFSATVAAIPGSYSYVCSDKYSYFFQDQCDQQVTNGTVFGPSSLAQKVCVIYNTATVTPVLSETKPLLLDKYNYPSGNGWSSGRLPFLFVADATINGVTRRIHVVTIHAKSGSAAADFNRRRQDFDDLKKLLDADYPKANIVMLGDYNDKATASIYTNSTISSFNNFVSDAANYTTVTKPLEQQGCSTFNSSASFIDHMIVSNDLAAGYIDNSAYVLLPFSIPNYGNTTSDHNPIFARFDLSKLAVTVVKAFSRDPDNGQLNSNTLKPYLTLQNGGNTSVEYSTLTARYWLNVENNMDLIFQKNYVAIGQNNLNLRYVPTSGRQGVTGYIEYSFNAGAGSLAPMSESGPIEIQVYKQNYSAFNQAGDYSYVNNSAFTLNNRITVYQGGSLIYGVEPAITNAPRLGAEEAGTALHVSVLGNPVVNESVEVEIHGAAGQKLQLQMIDNRGRSVNTTVIEHAAAVERATISVGKSTGVYLLQATTATQKHVVKLVKE